MMTDLFVRKMTEPLIDKTKAATTSGKEALQEVEKESIFYDFGGPDGHVAESIFGTEILI